jgi:hypothetical protein
MELEEPNTSWITTFCDMSFVVLAFFVLQFAFTVPNKPPVKQAAGEELADGFELIRQGETTVVYGAFNPSNSDSLSWRGRAAIEALSRQAGQLGQEIKVEVVHLSGDDVLADTALDNQRLSVIRHFLSQGVLLSELVVAPKRSEKRQLKDVSMQANLLTSRLEITLQPKRS